MNGFSAYCSGVAQAHSRIPAAASRACPRRPVQYAANLSARALLFARHSGRRLCGRFEMRRHPADPLDVAFPGRMTLGQDRTELLHGYRPGAPDPQGFSFGDFPSTYLDRSCGGCSSTPLPERLRVLSDPPRPYGQAFRRQASSHGPPTAPRRRLRCTLELIGRVENSARRLPRSPRPRPGARGPLKEE